MTIAVHTTKSNKWDTRTLTFHSEGMTKIADSNHGNASNGNNGSNGSLTSGGNNNNPGNGSNGNNQEMQKTIMETVELQEIIRQTMENRIRNQNTSLI